MTFLLQVITETQRSAYCNQPSEFFTYVEGGKKISQFYSTQYPFVCKPRAISHIKHLHLRSTALVNTYILAKPSVAWEEIGCEWLNREIVQIGSGFQTIIQ